MNNFRNLALWIIIALILVALLHVFQGPNQRQGRSSLTYTAFNQQVLADAVKEVSISGRHIEGSMKNGGQFTTEMPENDAGDRAAHGRSQCRCARASRGRQHHAAVDFPELVP